METWIQAHLVDEHVNSISKEKMLRVRYANGEEEVVCQGVVHRPYLSRPAPPKGGAACRLTTLQEHVSQKLSPPPPYAGYNSSVDEDPKEWSTDVEADVTSDLEETMTEANLPYKKQTMVLPSPHARRRAPLSLSP